MCLSLTPSPNPQSKPPRQSARFRKIARLDRIRSTRYGLLVAFCCSHVDSRDSTTDLLAKRIPKQKPDRVILQFDYDCFYAQVFENKNPALKALPLGVRQKNILATCNYNARDKGVKKLMLVSEAKRLCPELVLVDGEDLTPFRDASKILFNFLKSHTWSNKAERLGFDEVFIDVTDVIDYNIQCLNRTSLAESFFHLSSKYPELGFDCDLTSMAGCVVGHTASPPALDLESSAYLRLLLGSHFANYLRTKIEEDFGFTSTCGISTNKLLSKLVGSKNKPRNQTTLLVRSDEDVVGFVDTHTLRQIPGIGFKTAQILESHITGQRQEEADSHSFNSIVTTRQVRLHESVSAASLEEILGGPGAERGIGARVWGLLHGVESVQVKEASDVPSQISIEDTYKGLETMGQIVQELHKLSHSLIRRMRVDLLVTDEDAETSGATRWLARPKILRLSVRSWPLGDDAQHSMNYNRISRSGPLPNFVFGVEDDISHISERLVAEALLPLLRRLQPEKGRRWNLQLINICATNMLASATNEKSGAGRDISAMFKRQDEFLKPWKVTVQSDDDMDVGPDTSGNGEEEEEDDDDGDVSWADVSGNLCPQCGHSIPAFAVAAHARFHELGE